ncbi:PREDICTED: protein SUPPRESSOR OF GENE SILENCING 3 [Tarenaya hassleriana]|uniref:protein SUPPRESSOR OF GENE SILENCING 3 n=1 Tax=Tarenaya hassleriana TaxID=28532 RepID=UPI00053C5B8D|nr:PREDICTED: protein SUPPRESSOR OF GENE SILENCING 3 [Tarenaya hassleriana]XP_010521622.1 PREDICTED: protein SUPPRESSOR OF GENE SILENCING 3 [Tarenaya hassleriana]
MSLRSGSRSSKGKNISEGSNPDVDQLSHGVAGTKLVPSQDDGGEWEVIGKKNKNKSGNTGGKSWAPQSSNSRTWGNPGRGSSGNVPRGNANAWGVQATDPRVSAGRGNPRNQNMNRGYDNSYGAPQPAIRPPLEKGWNWQSRPGAALFRETQQEQEKREADEPENFGGTDEEDDYGSDALDDSDEDLLSDDYDSDDSQKSHGTRKKNKWFKKFFESLDSLSIEQINEPQRQWHCPACQNGPGSIDWYCLQPLITHARTKGARRVKLHRELAEILDEELRRRGASVIPAGEVYGQWKGLGEEEKDHEIVWPPMVMIMNTRLDKDDNDKWVGMGNAELLEYFSNYPANRARHSYGPQGHRGMSVLIFEGSATGYLEAERLARDLAEQGLDRNAWDRRRNLLYAGKRQLYGFLASKEDLDIFNQHSQGKTALKFEMRSYREMVVKELRQISEDNQQLNWLKNKLTRQSNHAKVLEESLEIMSAKLRKTTEENRIVRQRTKMQHEQNRQEMDSQDKFFKEQIQMIHEARDEQEENFEMLQQQERAKVKEQNANSSSNDDYRRRAEEISSFIEFQEKEMDEFVREREKLIEEHEKKMAEMRQRHYEEELELEREFDDSLNLLMDKYSPHSP